MKRLWHETIGPFLLIAVMLGGAVAMVATSPGVNP
jgi:hypothetical protein